jgi:hypothetical protein
VKRRAIGTCVLLAYLGMVGVAGWPGNVRPAFLDAAHWKAVYALRLLGISAGQPLFQTDVSPWKQHAFCLNLRSDSGELLFPPGGDCRSKGFLWTIPPLYQATHRLLSSAFDQAQSGRTPGSDAFVAALGRTFCLKTEPRPAEIQGIWTWYYKHYDDGTVLRSNGLLFVYSCERASLTQLAWQPDDDAVRAFWGGLPRWR